MTPRMRTIAEAAAEIKRLDPDTAITPYYIRNLVLSGKIPHLRVGAKRLINLDILITYLNSPAPEPEESPIERGVIRRIAE